MVAPSDGSSARRTAPVLFAVALLFNLGLLALAHWPGPKRLVGDETYYFNLAAAIAAGQPVQHDPLWPPLYGELLALIFRLAGPSVLAVQVVQIGLWLAAAYCFWRIIQRLAPAASIVALALFFLSPELAAFSHYLWPEMAHLALFLAALWLIIGHGARLWAAAAAGLLLGLALLSKSLLWPVLPLILLFTALDRSEGASSRRRLLNAGLIGAAAAVAVLGATAVAERSGRPWPVAGSTVFNLWLGLADQSPSDTRDPLAGQEYARFVAAGPDLAARNAVYLDKIADRVAEQGVAQTLALQAGKQYFRLFDHRTFWTTQLPGGPRAAYAFDSPLLATALRLYSALYYALVLAAGALGMAGLRFRPLSWLLFLWLYIAANLAIFLLLHAVTRYTVQFLPAWLAFAAVALLAGCQRLRRREKPELAGFVFTPGRLAAGTLLAALTLWLAFRSLMH